jgi:glutamate-1-semialdehyde 2,1-aminomutase
MEPVQRGFVVPDLEFLKVVRETTRELGIVLIFDEVMSGFRMEKFGGASTTYGIDPDMICLGKIIGGGFPCGAFMGKRELMDMVNPATKPKDERVFHGGTFNGHPTVLAAGMATLDVLEEPRTYPYLNKISDRLRNGFNDLFGRMGYEAEAIGPGSTFNIVFTKGKISDYRDVMKCDSKTRQKLDFGLMARGMHLHPDKPFYTCTEHSEKDVDRTLKVAEEVLKKMKE